MLVQHSIKLSQHLLPDDKKVYGEIFCYDLPLLWRAVALATLKMLFGVLVLKE